MIETNLIYDKKIYIDESCDFLGGSLPINNSNEKHLLEEVYEILKVIENPIMIDVGANMGSFSLLAKFIPAMTVYSFEPYIDIFNILKNNIRFNNIEDRVLPFNIACSNIKGSSILKCCPKFSGMSCMGPNFKFDKCQIIEKSVITDTLDSIMYKINPLKINLIKIDTEGCEFFVIKGAEKLIRKFKPLIIAECVERRTVNFNYNHHEIIELLKSMGYKIEQISENDILAS